MHPGVYRFTAAPESAIQRIWGAVLAVGGPAVASHEGSLILHGVDRIPADETPVSVPPGYRANHPGIRVHRFSDLRSDHLHTIGGIPTTTLERAVVDITSVFRPRRLEWLVDRVTVTERKTTIGAISRVLRQVNHRGRRQIGLLGELLDARTTAEPIPRSQLERQMDELLAALDLPPPRHEYPLPSLVPGEGFVDRAWPEAGLILEIDGRVWHARERSMRVDRARDRAAAREGWQTLRVLDEEVTDVPEGVIDDLLAVYEVRIGKLVRS